MKTIAPALQDIKKDDRLMPDEDLARAIPFEDFKKQALNHVRKLYLNHDENRFSSGSHPVFQ